MISEVIHNFLKDKIVSFIPKIMLRFVVTFYTTLISMKKLQFGFTDICENPTH